MPPVAALLLISIVWLTPAALSAGSTAAESPSGVVLAGKVTSSDGKPLEGVAVSAQAHNKTFTTTVYTDGKGEYFFPPLDDGRYRTWAQAVSFEAARAELNVEAGQERQQDFSLQNRKGFEKQLSGTEWMASLPAANPQDRRMKALFRYYCANCHVASFVLQNRFDATGWGSILNLMSRIQIYTRDTSEVPPNPWNEAYKEELIGYLTRLRGPHSSPPKFQPLPRPTGESARVVVTEYDISPGDRSGYISSQTGSDWSQGTPSTYEGRSIHDVMVDSKGDVWFGNTVPLERTIAMLDPRTGSVADYKLPDQDSKAVLARNLVEDQQGRLWFTHKPNVGQGGALVNFDPKTGQFQEFPLPSRLSPMGQFVKLDSTRNIWYNYPDGAVKWDPKTGTYSPYRSSLTKGELPYECDVDANDTVWCTMMQSNRLVAVDSPTGKVSVLNLEPLEAEVMGKDREISSRIGGTDSLSPLFQKGPRRLAADRRGDSVWVAEFWGGRLAKIDIHSRKVTEYPLPHRDSSPYDVAVDKNHMVWINLMNSDRVAKFNPYTEKFTEYPLPTLGTEARNIAVDDRTDPPTVWVPYYRVNKIARVQIRTAAAGATNHGEAK